jgi:16S rRNA (adenine1518-N6/adenine1519-N6)-dimethyltransferase
MNATPFSPKALLASHGLRAKRSFGQNFLTDSGQAARIAQLAVPEPGGTVVEIGAGLGALTRPLLGRAERVVAIERDRDLVPLLSEGFAIELGEGRLELLEADAKQVDYLEVLSRGPVPHVIAGNLPYQITGPLLQLATGIAQSVARVVFLVQLEVADRITAHPGAPSYGALTVFVQAQFEPRRELVLRRGAFHPQPAVDSAVVLLAPRRPPLAEETAAFRAVVKAAFGKRRKTLRNAWQGLLGASPETIRAAAERAGIELSRRGETLDVTDFARMTDEVTR